MTKTMITIRCTIGTLLITVPCLLTAVPQQQKIRVLSKEIKSLSQEISKQKILQKELNDQLESANQEIQILQTSFKEVESNITYSEKKVKELQKQKAQHQLEIDNINQQLQRLIQFFYTHRIKESRTHKTNLKALMQHQTSLLRNLLSSFKKIHNTKSEILEEQQKMFDLHYIQKNQKKELEEQHSVRTHLLKQLSDDLQKKDRKLMSLLNRKKELEKVVKKTPTRSIRASETPVGNIAKPLSGRVLHQFGEQIFKSDQAYDGTIIESNYKDVHCVADGIVVFSHYLEGYGRLMIVDHGHGLLSIYGENTKLLKKVDQHVRKGEIIAKSSKTLYFGIRYHSKPHPTTHWPRKAV